MFSGDPAALRPHPRSLCLVADDRDLLNRGPDSIEATAARMRALGCAVHVLGCGRFDLGDAGWDLEGVRFSRLDEQKLPPAERTSNVHGACPSDRADRVRYSLHQLHKIHSFDRIEFPCLAGLGFRAVQAKRAGLTFADVELAVRLDATSASLRDQRQQWPGGVEDLERDFIERYTLENADVQVSVKKVSGPFFAAKKGPDTFLEPAKKGPDTFLTPGPLVSVCVPHYNLGRHLPETLASLAEQTYRNLEVLVIDDGSTDPGSRAVFGDMQERYPRFRFIRQANAGIGATRNRGLAEARGEYFLPMDADNIACPDMIERLVSAIEMRPDLGAMTCYFLAFRDSDDLRRRDYAYAYRPTGGPHMLACLRNVYGDATAIYRTAAFRAVGGYETDRDTSFEDWEAFVKLVHGGYAIDVVPAYLFYYRHLPTGFSRTTNHHANHQRVLRQFARGAALSPADGKILYDALMGFHLRIEHLEARQRSLRYRIVDRIHAVCRLVPAGIQALKRCVDQKP